MALYDDITRLDKIINDLKPRIRGVDVAGWGENTGTRTYADEWGSIMVKIDPAAIDALDRINAMKKAGFDPDNIMELLLALKNIGIDIDRAMDILEHHDDAHAVDF
jgi:hypothetical protein